EGLGYVADFEQAAHGLSWPGPDLMVTERRAHYSHRAIARPRDGRSRIARGTRSTRSTTWNRTHGRRFRRVAPGPRSTARSRHWREFSCLTQAQTRLPHSGGFAAIIGAMSAASLAEPLWRCQALCSRRQGFTARLGAGVDDIRCGTMPP